MIVYLCRGLQVTRERDGLRITIATAHSTEILTRAEAHEFTAELVKLFKKKTPKKGAT